MFTNSLILCNIYRECSIVHVHLFNKCQADVSHMNVVGSLYVYRGRTRPYSMQGAGLPSNLAKLFFSVLTGVAKNSFLK